MGLRKTGDRGKEERKTQRRGCIERTEDVKGDVKAAMRRSRKVFVALVPE